ncbi:DUF6461 domain-containing protein [Streptomyces sp. NPDC048845]|uniref:DUF6461 domain-containing protein n=1 Tax=Streptomyces sp. NPDC048845 TaxID=3155390 RepID=UPI003420DEEB
MNTKTFPNSQLYRTGYCAMFARRVSPSDLLAKMTSRQIHPIPLNRMEAEAVKAFGGNIEEELIPDLDIGDLHLSGLLTEEGPLLRAGTYGDWSYVIESEGSYLTKEELLESASSGTVAFSARLAETGSSWISYAEDGKILSSFDPLFPYQDYGQRPEVLEALTGYRESIDSGDRSESYENALRKIQQELNCVVPHEADAARMLAIRIRGC